MKKALLMVFAVAAMASCTTNEVIDLNQEVIGFENAFIDNATRTIDPSITNETITDQTFQVWGTTQGDGTGEGLVQIFEGVDVSYTTAWAYDAGYNQYWIPGNGYEFAALVNGGPVVLGANKLPETVKYTNTVGTKDLLYATASRAGADVKASGNEAVAFTFGHLLSKVQFTFKNTMTTNTNESLYTYRVSDIKITNSVGEAVCTLATPEWKDHTGGVKLEFGNISDGTADDAIEVGAVGAAAEASSHNARLLIPAKYGDATIEALHITCTIETLLNGSVVDTQAYNNDVDVTLEPGRAYNFVISKGNPGELIQFTVTSVNGWVNGGDVNEE